MQLINGAENILFYIVQTATMLMEFFGVCVLVYTAVRCFIHWVKHREGIRLSLAKGIVSAFEGISPVLAREWLYRAGAESDVPSDEADSALCEGITRVLDGTEGAHIYGEE